MQWGAVLWYSGLSCSLWCQHPMEHRFESWPLHFVSCFLLMHLEEKQKDSPSTWTSDTPVNVTFSSVSHELQEFIKHLCLVDSFLQILPGSRFLCVLPESAPCVCVCPSCFGTVLQPSFLPHISLAFSILITVSLPHSVYGSVNGHFLDHGHLIGFYFTDRDVISVGISCKLPGAFLCCGY